MSFLIDWLWSLLYEWGFFQKKATILLVGLDNAGKTSLLQKLKNGQVRSVIPTQRAQLEEMSIGNVQLKAWDLGGHDQVRGLWRDYFIEADAIVFVIDSSDFERFEEAKKELHSLISDPQLANLAFLILANKVDLVTAASQAEMTEAMGLAQILADQKRKVKLFRCSITEGIGYVDGLKWLSGVL